MGITLSSGQHRSAWGTELFIEQKFDGTNGRLPALRQTPHDELPRFDRPGHRDRLLRPATSTIAGEIHSSATRTISAAAELALRSASSAPTSSPSSLGARRQVGMEVTAIADKRRRRQRSQGTAAAPMSPPTAAPRRRRPATGLLPRLHNQNHLTRATPDGTSPSDHHDIDHHDIPTGTATTTAKSPRPPGRRRQGSCPCDDQPADRTPAHSSDALGARRAWDNRSRAAHHLKSTEAGRTRLPRRRPSSSR